MGDKGGEVNKRPLKPEIGKVLEISDLKLKGNSV
jgi:hypothetical protein